jgi:ligand-binding SRPBCC domain-containing protein
VRFERRFVVRAPLDAVRAFHEDPRALRRLTPLAMSDLDPLAPPREGGRVRFRMWLGPVPVAWAARFEAVRDDGFADVQEAGPFRAWRHERRWRALPDGATEVADRIEADPGGALSRILWAGLPAAFAYRAWRTRRALETPTPSALHQK